MGSAVLQFTDSISRQRFLDEFWQKRPVLLRQAIPPDCFELTPDELAGLACEEDVESRLICERQGNRWELRHGPFEADDFSRLPASHWTLLVQDVDKHVPQVAALLDAFDFVPDWRLDDIMISYASDQGGVGPHTDNYDVFLLQAWGERRWRISEQRFCEADLLPDCPLRVLREFHTDSDMTLQPGDMLYLPPGVAHWGTAEGECMTWSVGMRGLSDAELLAGWLERLPSTGRAQLHDQVDAGTANPSLLSGRDLDHVRAVMANALPADDVHFRRWVGCQLTEPKPDFEIALEQSDMQRTFDMWAQGRLTLRRHPWARFAMLRISEDRLALCAQGQALEYPVAFQATLEYACQSRRLRHAMLAESNPHGLREVILDLLRLGWLQPDD